MRENSGRNERRTCKSLVHAVLICMLLSLWCAGQDTSLTITTKPPQVQYVSGGSLYVEGLSHNRWVARNWTFASHPVAHDWDLPAFEIGVKTDPAAMGVPPIELSEWRFVQAQELPDTARSARHAVVTLSSMRMPVTVKVHTVLDGTSVLIRWLEITNESNASIALMSVAPLAGQLWPPSSHIELGHATREDCCEGWFGWNKLPLGMTRFHHEIGLSADHPYFILRNEQDREYFFAQLEWPLNRVMEFNNSGKGISFQMGPAAATALRIIGPYETIDTPKMHVGHTKGDFDNAVQDMLDHIRRSVLLPRKANLAYRIETLMPEDWPFTLYRGTQFNETNIKKFLKAASQLGVEVFILDGPMWCANYGEWLTPQKQEFPNGLSPIVDYAHNHHMLFGLYVEPEGGRDGYTSMEHGLTIGPWRNSEVYRQHPYWFKGNMVLDLGDPAPEAYMQSELEKIIRQYPIDLYRNDFNSPLQGEGTWTQRGSFVDSDYWRHYAALDRVFDHIHADFPDLILQQASAGGTRLDLGTVSRFPEDYTSDDVTIGHVYRMLSGISVYLPPEALVTPIGMAPRQQLPDLDTMLRSIYALGNTPFIFNSLIPKDAEHITPELRAKFLHYTKMYQNFIRPMLATDKVYHIAPVNADGGVESGNWFAMEFTSPDQHKGWAVVIRLSDDSSQSYLLKLRGLDSSKDRKITVDSTGGTRTVSAGSAERDGLRIQPARNTRSELLLFNVQ